MSKTGKTYATWIISAGMGAALALGGALAVAQDDGGAGGPIEASALIGVDVHDANGTAIGEITHLWLDPKDGRVKNVSVSAGETPGARGTGKVVAWGDVRIAWKGRQIFATVDPAALR